MRRAAGWAVMLAGFAAVYHWRQPVRELIFLCGWPAVALSAVLIICATVNAFRRPAPRWPADLPPAGQENRPEQLPDAAGDDGEQPAGRIPDDDWSAFAAGHGYPVPEE